jgi:hypothetical protein
LCGVRNKFLQKLPEKVAQLPPSCSGCGEQNMVGLVPNIYLLQYLKSNAKVRVELNENVMIWLGDNIAIVN